MLLRLKRATVNDIPDIVKLCKSVNEKLGSQLGRHIWSKFLSTEGVHLQMHKATVEVAREEGILVAMFTLSMQKPWSIDERLFKPALRPLYLTDLAVHPLWRRHGIEQLCIGKAIRIAEGWPSDSLRLDTSDIEFGSEVSLNEFGFRSIGTNWLYDPPSIYFERPICKTLDLRFM
jgi:GNAT superfamily N-acetyltransferase